VTPDSVDAPRGRLIAAAAVLLAAVLQVLDSTIVNIALPDMMGTFGATSDQITWVLTAYIVASAIVMPITGRLTAWLGRRRLMLLSIAGFVAGSCLCGVAWDLPSMVTFRVLQGVAGAAITPVAQAVLVDSYPGRERGRAMAAFGIGVVVAPTLGPTLGGWLTETFDWRAVFYVNAPLGLAAFLLAAISLPRTPVRPARTDWVGLSLLACGVGATQLVLDRGQELDWLAAPQIQACAVVALGGLLLFVIRGWGRAGNIVNLDVFRSRSFSLASATMFLFSMGLFASMAALPQLAEGLMGYSAESAGLVMMPRGMATIASMAVAGVLIRRVDARALIGVGAVFCAWGSLAMAHLSLQAGPVQLAAPGIILGLGMGLVFAPLSTTAYETLAKDLSDEAAGVYNLVRALGGSTGISIAGAVAADRAQAHWNTLADGLRAFSPAVRDWIKEPDRGPAPLARLAGDLAAQAQFLAFLDVFLLVAAIFAATLLMAPFLRGGQGAAVTRPPPPRRPDGSRRRGGSTTRANFEAQRAASNVALSVASKVRK
jgi:DHA2 family multidrug resistance protein